MTFNRLCWLPAPGILASPSCRGKAKSCLFCSAQGLPACLHQHPRPAQDPACLHSVPADTTSSHGIWNQGRGSTELPQVQEKKSRVAGQEEPWLWVRSGLSLALPVVALGTQSSPCLVSLSLWEILVLNK